MECLKECETTLSTEKKEEVPEFKHLGSILCKLCQYGGRDKRKSYAGEESGWICRVNGW